MIDIFEELTPKVYSVDINILAEIPMRGNKIESKRIKLKNEPITLVNGNIASEKIKKRFLYRVYNDHINRSEFDKISFVIESIVPVKFLSNICYKIEH